MKKILLAAITFCFSVSTQAALYIVVVGQQSADLTNLCPGDTVRFSGDSLNGFVYGIIQGEVENVNSQFNDAFNVSSYINVATHWDHILVAGDIGYYFSVAPPQVGNFIFNCTTGISLDAKAEAAVSFYPNPASTQVEISSSMQIEYVKVYDYFGKKITDQQVNNKKELLDISTLPNGIYLVEIKTESESIFKKLIKN